MKNTAIKEITAKKIVIVGGVAGGMSAAARARRLSEQSEIIVFERTAHVSYANCGLPYYLGGEIKSQANLLVATPQDLKDKFNLDIRVKHEVIAIDKEAKTVTVRDIAAGRDYQESYDDLILSVGAAALRPDIPGIDGPGRFVLRTIEDVANIENWIEQQKPSTAVIAGGGFIGLEMAEQLTKRGMAVTLVDNKEQVLSPIDIEMAALVHSELKTHGVKLLLGKPIVGFSQAEKYQAQEGSKPKSCWVHAGNEAPVAADLVILGMGVRAETTLAKQAGLTIGERGGIRVDSKLQSSAANIWAVGDAIEVLNPISQNWTLIALGGPANRQGRLVAENILGAKKTYQGTIGTAILRIFDITVATVGLNQNQLINSGRAFEALHLHPTNHASYYPGATRLDIKVLFDPASGQLLGAQIVGQDGVDKRIDVFATAIKAGMTMRDLAELELAYAPPFGSAKDPINLTGMAATNILDGLISQVQWQEIGLLKDSESCIVDVRTDGERERGYIPGSKHIPLQKLRQRYHELPKDRMIITYCQSGQRSYNAARFLQQHGYTVKNLSGGYLTWHAAESLNSEKANNLVQTLPCLSQSDCSAGAKK
ncbi:MAG: hypothetical protein QG625_555 [Cyanobacteriota bacterium erpe_2018_sw_39hr_WHONDRS-SW48-000098_B_bin.30]|nr:hypothetical protein [Cyanobacteriota bacterium erpe_2018_sw_39hr_WHONDRS-SW48-000098_B_bin.30]